MFSTVAASVKHHYMFTSWDSIELEPNGVTFRWVRTIIVYVMSPEKCWTRSLFPPVSSCETFPLASKCLLVLVDHRRITDSWPFFFIDCFECCFSKSPSTFATGEWPEILNSWTAELVKNILYYPLPLTSWVILLNRKSVEWWTKVFLFRQWCIPVRAWLFFFCTQSFSFRFFP